VGAVGRGMGEGFFWALWVGEGIWVGFFLSRRMGGLGREGAGVL